MDRRTALSLLGGGLGGALAGCLTSPPGPSGDGDREGTPLAFDARYAKDPNDVPIIEPGLAHDSALGPHYVTLIAEAAETDRFDFEYMDDQPDVDDGIVPFVRGTDFASSCLLVVQTVLPSGSLAFELDAVRRVDDAELHAYTTTPPARGGTGEVLRATIFARVKLAGAAAPDRVVVTYTNDAHGTGETTRFASDTT